MESVEYHFLGFSSAGLVFRSGVYVYGHSR